MTKTTRFHRVCFPRETIEEAIREMSTLGQIWVTERSRGSTDAKSNGCAFSGMRVGRGDTEWNFDDHDEFLGDLAEPYTSADCMIEYEIQERYATRAVFALSISSYLGSSRVSASASSRGSVERLLAPFSKAAPRLRVPEPEPEPEPEPIPPEDPDPVVFIGHGQSPMWRDLKDHLADLHKYEIQAYETGARGGHTIRDVLESMLRKSTFAILVMTAEDGQEDGSIRARQNVVHEAGLFQGRLGFSRVAILLERGVETFSNIDGVQYIEFSPGNIRETFGDVVGTLRREFPPRGK